MNYTAPFNQIMDFDNEHNCPRWSYQTSDARSEPLPPPRPTHQIVPPSPPTARPPPPTKPPPPVEINKGVWFEDDDIRYSSDWPPVQQYLANVREQKTMLPPPSDLVFALAAIEVVQCASDIAHWIFWSQSKYLTTGGLVESIALQKPRLIKNRVPWNGAREYKLLVNAWQYKFYCVQVKRQWYSTDCTGGETHKRVLRSTSDQMEEAVYEYFGIIANEGPSRRRSGKSATKKHTQTTSPNKRTRRPVATEPQPPASSSPEPLVVADGEDITIPIQPSSASLEASSLPSRASTRVRRKLTPSAKSPRIISAPVENSSSDENLQPAESPSSSMPPPLLPSIPSSSHARNRSSSAQSSVSVDTLVEVERSPSVTSVETVVTPTSPKKRKLDDIEKDEEVSKDPEPEASATEGMVTRNRASKIRSLDSDTSLPSSRTSTPAVESRAKPSRQRARAKRARV
ncbi:hypothetical protein BDZ97DRAFT_1801745 [Flammula alnicola]|nr:hypothetical protein BDZ97DRAFT_1801745 [Flammula alnicola]